MSKMSLVLTLRLFSVVIALFLVSCGGEPVKPDDEPLAEKTLDVKKPVLSQEEQEPPGVEIIPRKSLDEPKISMQPLESDSPSEESVQEVTGEEKAEVDVKEETKEAPPAPAMPAIVAAPPEPSAAEEPVEKTIKQPEIAVQETPVQKELSKPLAQKESSKPAILDPVPVAIPADPNTFIVTVGKKAAPHPALGKGHLMGFMINGVSGKRLLIERGKSYTFDIRTDPKHDVYLSKKAIGWGSTPLAEGVTGAYTYKGKMTFSPTKSTPSEVYYACRNHPHMGALIQVVDPGGKAKKVKSAVVSTKASPVYGDQDLVSEVSASKVKQKLMFAEMMSNSKGSKRVLASQNDEAKQLLVEAKSTLLEGREKSLAGSLPEALALANKSLRMMSEAARLVPGEEEMAQLAENYKSALGEIRGYQKSYKDNLARLEKTGAVPEGAMYDEKDMAKKLSEAQLFADKKNYIRANGMLEQAQQLITGALHKMLDSTTLVYDLNFATAADEYNYELKRFVGYEELIPVAIEAKKPAPGAIKLMESFLAKARKRRDQAVAKADAGEHGDAIAMLQQATKTVRRALRMVGVMQ